MTGGAPSDELVMTDARDQMPLLLQSLLDRGAQVQPDNLIVSKTSVGYVTTTYQDYLVGCLRLADALTKWGVKRGDRVGTLMWNSTAHLQVCHAVSCMGAVIHTLNTRLCPKDLSYIAEHGGSRVLFVDSDLLELVGRLNPSVVSNFELFVCHGADGTPGRWTLPKIVPITKASDYHSFIASGSKEFVWPEFSECSPHALCYTSGTTSLPKGVLYSHRSTYLTLLTMVGGDQYNMSGSMTILPIVPLFHVLSWGIPLAALMLGSRIVLTGRHNTPDDCLNTMHQWKVEVTTGVPAVFQSIMEVIKRRDVDVVKQALHLRTIISGGSAPSKDMLQWYHETLGVEFTQGWGMTETNPLGTFAKMRATHRHMSSGLDHQLGNITKAGMPVPGMEMRIVDKDNFDKEMPRGEPGELLVRGPFVITRYFKNAAHDKFHQGWLITGDVARFDDEYNLIICDRTKDTIKSGGEWISSVDLENCIVGMDEISTAVVVGVPHPRWDERPIAVVTLSQVQNAQPMLSASMAAGDDGRNGLAERVRSHCLSTNFAKFQLPDDVLVWEALPLTSTGKLDKKAVRDRLQKEGYLLPSIRAPKSKI